MSQEAYGRLLEREVGGVAARIGQAAEMRAQTARPAGDAEGRAYDEGVAAGLSLARSWLVDAVGQARRMCELLDARHDALPSEPSEDDLPDVNGPYEYCPHCGARVEGSDGE